MSKLLRTPEVARLLGLSVERFYRVRPKLEAEGFPRPRAPFTNRWSADAVTAWINAQSEPAPEPSPAAATLPADEDGQGWAAYLRGRLPSGAAA